jgi:hypothetical protein
MPGTLNERKYVGDQAPGSDREEYLAQVEKLVKSQTLHTSEALCKILQYLATHNLDRPGIPIKEYQIATEVLGRPPDFDPHSDATIRVQAGRLRSKLTEYYGSEGAYDSILVDLPKGSYHLSFQRRNVPTPSTVGGADLQPAVGLKATGLNSNRGLIAVVAVVSLLLVVSLLIIAGLIRGRATPSQANLQGIESRPGSLSVFWRLFLGGSQEPFVIFSNAKFVGRPETGMRYYDRARDTNAHILDHYTGVGEVLAVRDLDRVFTSLHREIRVKRGSMFTMDDAQNNDLIFVGSPAENLALLELPNTHEFVFHRETQGVRKGDLGIANLHPREGEPAFFLPTPVSLPLDTDYAIVALLPGLNPSRSLLILAGTSTVGTQAAVEFVCRQDSVGDLLGQLGVHQDGKVPPFEAVLRVNVRHDVPIGSKIVALRK